MHEFSICEGLVSALLEELKKAGPGRLVEARVVAGAMHQIVPDYMQTAYALLTRETAAEGSRLELCVRPVTVSCTACEWSGDIDLPFFRCGQCGSPTVDLRTGKELYLDRLRMEETEAVENRS